MYGRVVEYGRVVGESDVVGDIKVVDVEMVRNGGMIKDLAKDGRIVGKMNSR